MSGKRRVLFHRTWTKPNGGTSGGQMKVRDAFLHFKSSGQFEPKVYFPPTTLWTDNPGNVWRPFRQEGLPEWSVQPEDVLFFSGHDWNILSKADRQHPPAPILNIAQPRHTNPTDKRNAFLRHPAIRIAKSSVGKEILEEYGVNGPVFLIPDSIDFSRLPAPNPAPETDLLIVGIKNPGLARRLEQRLKRKNRWRWRKWKIKVQTPPLLPTRQDFLHLLNSAKTIAFLPLDESRGAEGFYLPALEGMYLEKLVICPYAVGNIDFCIPEKTCIQPEYTEDAIFAAILRTLYLSDNERRHFIQQAKATTANHDIRKEKQAMLNLLHQADTLWSDETLFKYGK
ncbi:MAG: hypothetical protein RIC19_17855 [Phaeodactylibacter sp.]|uniref:hypothetical protein n=1 Tax=Phaeodactylibacter sp. TaxID=1940289 RepID=UPI0032F05B0B